MFWGLGCRAEVQCCVTVSCYASSDCVNTACALFMVKMCELIPLPPVWKKKIHFWVHFLCLYCPVTIHCWSLTLVNAAQCRGNLPITEESGWKSHLKQKGRWCRKEFMKILKTWLAKFRDKVVGKEMEAVSGERCGLKWHQADISTISCTFSKRKNLKEMDNGKNKDVEILSWDAINSNQCWVFYAMVHLVSLRTLKFMEETTMWGHILE